MGLADVLISKQTTSRGMGLFEEVPKHRPQSNSRLLHNAADTSTALTVAVCG